MLFTLWVIQMVKPNQRQPDFLTNQSTFSRLMPLGDDD